MTVVTETSPDLDPEIEIQRRDFRAATFQMVMGPITVVALLVWLGLQQVMPLADPAMLDVILTSLGVYYYAEFVRIVFDKNTARIKWIRRISGVFFIVFSLLQMANIAAISYEIEEPCARLRKSFIAKPDSNVSDAYEALHCTLTIESRVKSIWKGIAG